MPPGALTLPPRSLHLRRMAGAAIAIDMKRERRRIDDPAVHDGAPKGTAWLTLPGSSDRVGGRRRSCPANGAW
jgi:hypothetical protein